MNVHATELIERLHRLQRRHGWLPPAALVQLAQQLQLPLSQVQGVATFYHLFALRPPAPHRLGVCHGTACWLQGAPRLIALLGERLAGAAGWELAVLGCVGGCAQAPLLLCDGQAVLRLPLSDAQLLQRRLDQLGLP